VRRLVLIVRCLFWATGAQVQAQIFDRGTWNDLLQRHVKPILGGVATQVDYAGMARERTRLKGYLDTLAAVPEAQFWRWPKDERPAFLINAYNAWTVERVLTRWPKLDSIKDLGSLLESPWKRRFIPLLGQTRSLGGPGGARGDRRLEVSSLFKWYGEDFDRLGGLCVFLADQGEALGHTNVQRRSLRDGFPPVSIPRPSPGARCCCRPRTASPAIAARLASPSAIPMPKRPGRKAPAARSRASSKRYAKLRSS